jgi:hypothetical protein
MGRPSSALAAQAAAPATNVRHLSRFVPAQTLARNRLRFLRRPCRSFPPPPSPGLRLDEHAGHELAHPNLLGLPRRTLRAGDGDPSGGAAASQGRKKHASPRAQVRKEQRDEACLTRSLLWWYPAAGLRRRRCLFLIRCEPPPCRLGLRRWCASTPGRARCPVRPYGCWEAAGIL